MEWRQISNSERKRIGALQQAKHRREQRRFVVEGTRSVADSIGEFAVETIVATSAWLDANVRLLPPSEILKAKHIELLTASAADMDRLSGMKTPQGVIAVCRMPEGSDSIEAAEIDSGELTLALDGVQDPGNLGTIIRVADWFDVRLILASHDTVDMYNPKVVQSTMGALSRVRVVYCDLPQLLAQARERGADIYGTFLDGDDIYRTRLGKGGIVVMGNEGNGISAATGREVNRRLLIPTYPSERRGEAVESLNVAMATGITLGEFRRRQR